MPNPPFTPEEAGEIREWFGTSPEQLTEETFRTALRALRAKYHPDNFEKFGDDTVRQLATDRFQRIERLAEKIEAWWQGNIPHPAPGPRKVDSIDDPLARFAYQAMKIEIRTADKDLKYHIFGTFYRWLAMGDRFKIPETQAFLIADEEHLGHSIGFKETIRVYLTFAETDSVEAIVDWLYPRIAERADTLLIESQIVPIERAAMIQVIKRHSLLTLAAEH